MTPSTNAPAFPMPRRCPFGPPEDYAAIRSEEPISRVTLQDGSTAWLITRYDHARQLLSSDKVSSDRTQPGYPALAPGVNVRQPGAFATMDPPEHAKHRRIVAGEFTVKQVKSMRPQIQRITDEAIDTLLDGPSPGDLVQAVSLPVPSMVICELLGVPYADRDDFQTRSQRLLALDIAPQERMVNLHALRAYLSELISTKEVKPADDLLSRAIAKYRSAGHYDPQDLIGMSVLLLVAGHETTANMISLITLSLLEDDGLRQRLRRDPGDAMALIEEMLRRHSIADYVTSRAATADIQIGDTVIRRGEGVIVSSAAANHDPEVFNDPHQINVDVGRRHHLAFGFGIHQCVGQNLARLELEVVITTLFARLPELKLAVELPQVPLKTHSGVHGLERLPVSW